MPTICRLLQLSAAEAASLAAQPGNLIQSVESAKGYTDVYRYWHAIQYLLIRHRPASPQINWLGLGQAVSAGTEDIPAARVLPPAEVKQLDALLQEIEPDDLIPHYAADALDKAAIYPRTWTDWEETFDPLGQVLEHYSYLREFVGKRATAGDGLLLYFVLLNDGSVS
jgi:hypothetical protein